jgi:hypothetical protein
VVAHRLLREDEPARDLVVAVPGGDQVEDLPLTRGELGEHLRGVAPVRTGEEVDDAAGDGGTVAINCTHSGRHTGDYFGIRPSGRNFSYKQMHMIRIRNGKGIEHWAVRDDATLMRQLTGELSAPDPSE